MRILITCPPMLGMIEELKHLFEESGTEIHCPDMVQTLSEEELAQLLPEFDGWIIGDDPATRRVFEAGQQGRLRAAVKWGVGTDNVDFDACKELGIPIANTPAMFGCEVADIAMGYVIGLARETFSIHAGVLEGRWPKPRGISLSERTMGLVGFGDIGRNVARRALASDMRVIAYDPFAETKSGAASVEFAGWPDRIGKCDFLVFTCALTPENRHMLNAEVLANSKAGVRIVNVARGPLIDEIALIDGLASGQVHSAALDVFETEPLRMDSPLRSFKKCIFGSHNASNTEDAVVRASKHAITILFDFLDLRSGE